MEGPSLVILSEELQQFCGSKIVSASGNTTIDKAILVGQKVTNITSWGKHLIMVFETCAIRIHFLMFGSYRINETKEGKTPRLMFNLPGGEINFYSCSIQFIDTELYNIYDWRIDIMSEKWDEKFVLKKVKLLKDQYACDVLMMQDVFAGVGNIIKNEVLFNLQVHPLSQIGNMPPALVKKLVLEARAYSFSFYKWKKEFQLKKHWLIYRKRTCPRCKIPVEIKKTGKGQRASFFCASCQRLFIDKPTKND